jgi:hypothetical protein
VLGIRWYYGCYIITIWSNRSYAYIFHLER